MKLKDFLTKKEINEIKELVIENPEEILDYKIEGKNISNTLTEDQQLQKIEDWCYKK